MVWFAPVLSPGGGITPYGRLGGLSRPDPCALTLPTQNQAHLTALAMPLRRDKLGGSRPRYRGVVVEPEVVASDAHLRPIERRIRRLVAAGVDPAEVAWRFRRSRRSVSQILALSSRPGLGRVLRAIAGAPAVGTADSRLEGGWCQLRRDWGALSPQSAVCPSRGGSGAGEAGPGRERRSVGRDPSQLVSRYRVVAHSSQPDWQGPEDPYPRFRFLGTGLRKRCHSLEMCPRWRRRFSPAR